MSNRRFEMFEIRVIILRMRRGDSDRCLAKAGLIGRRKAGELRELAQRQGWLDPSTPVPDNPLCQDSCRLYNLEETRNEAKIYTII